MKTLKTILPALLFLSILCLLSCSNDTTKNDLSNQNLTGKVKTLTESIYKAVDTLGKTQKISLSFMNSYTYDKNGNKSEWREYYAGFNRHMESQYESWLPDSLKKKNVDNSDGKLYKKHIYTYDDKGKLIESNTYNQDSSLFSKSTFIYDDKGNQIEEDKYEPNGELFLKLTFKYDEDGNKLENKYFSNSDTTFSSKATYSYNDKGKRIEACRYDRNDSLTNSYKYKYNSKGYESETNFVSSLGTSFNRTFIYENFDEEGNWLILKRYDDGVLKIISEREIEYY